MVEQEIEIDLPVSFGGVSIGESTARLAMKIDRQHLRITRADKLLCGRRLTGKVELGGNEDSPSQTTMFEKEMSVDATFDIHRFGVTETHFTTGATFKLKEIAVGDLAKFSKGAGRLVVDEVIDIPADVVEEKAAAGHLPGQYKAKGKWTKHSLDEMFVGNILKSMKAAGLETVGDLHEFQQPEKNGHIKQLTDIKGIGAAKVSTIEDTMLNFWKDNPDASTE